MPPAQHHKVLPKQIGGVRSNKGENLRPLFCLEQNTFVSDWLHFVLLKRNFNLMQNQTCDLLEKVFPNPYPPILISLKQLK